MTRVLHTADTHIGYRQYHSDERRRDFLDAFDRVIADAIEDDVDAVVHAGDLFHDKRPDLRDLQGTIAALSRLRTADIPFLGIVGNHERKRDAQWLDLFAELGLATRLGATPTMIEDVAVYGRDYHTPTRRSNDIDFEASPEAAYRVLVGHGIIEDAPHGDWDLEELLTASPVAFDAVLLGDYHEHLLREVDDAVVTYPGSTERASADETDSRGYNLVTFDDGITVSHRTLTANRDFAFIEVELGPAAGVDRVRERIDAHDIEDAVVIIDIVGDGESVAAAAIEEYAQEQGALLARVRDRREEAEGGANEVSVSFSDPDRAVEDALADAGISTGAYALDEVVRDLDVPDSHVRDRVRDRIDDLLEADPEALTDTADLDDAVASADNAGTEPADDDDAASDEAIIDTADESPPAEEPSPESDEQASVEDFL